MKQWHKKQRQKPINKKTIKNNERKAIRKRILKNNEKTIRKKPKKMEQSNKKNIKN